MFVIGSSKSWLIQPEGAEDELINNLNVKNDSVRVKVIKSLGQIGGEMP